MNEQLYSDYAKQNANNEFAALFDKLRTKFPQHDLWIQSKDFERFIIAGVVSRGRAARITIKHAGMTANDMTVDQLQMIQDYFSGNQMDDFKISIL